MCSDSRRLMMDSTSIRNWKTHEMGSNPWFLALITLSGPPGWGPLFGLTCCVASCRVTFVSPQIFACSALIKSGPPPTLGLCSSQEAPQCELPAVLHSDHRKCVQSLTETCGCHSCTQGRCPFWSPLCCLSREARAAADSSCHILSQHGAQCMK